MDELTIRSARTQRSLMEWSRRVAECRESGLTVTQWCAEHGIKPKTYYNWQTKVFAAMVEQAAATSKLPERRFAELPIPAVKNELIATVRISTSSLDIYTGASADVACALCKVLSKC